MNYLILDTESTGAQRESKGNALDPRNRLCYIGIRSPDRDACYPVEYSVEYAFGETLTAVQRHLNCSDILVLFNAKHDLHWLRRYGLKFRHISIWDCQLAEFIINGQDKPFPSLNDTAIKYGGQGKLDEVNSSYWSQGKDTDEVPTELLEEYLRGDLSATELVFLKQVEYLKDKPALKKLIWLNCQDEIITEDMEWNGLHFDINMLLRHADKLESDIITIDKELFQLVPYDRINWESPMQMSAVLYGGSIPYKDYETYTFTYANPKKAPVQKTRKITKEIDLPRLVEPLDRSETERDGVFSTADKVLRKLKATAKAKRIIDLILERRGTQTQIDRYFRGIPKIYQEMGWEDELVHGQLHHVVARTGRMSSSKPNQQNIDERARHCLKTRFK